MINAFGIEDGYISKADRKKQPGPTAGRIVAGAAFPGYHGAVAGKKGHKLKAVGYEVGGAVVGAGAPGAAVGTYLAHEHGRYKKQTVKTKTVSKAFTAADVKKALPKIAGSHRATGGAERVAGVRELTRTDRHDPGFRRYMAGAGVSKAFTKKGKEAKAERKRLTGSLSRREVAGVALGGPFYTASQAPKGKKGAAAKTQFTHTYKRGQNAYSGHAKAKEVHGFEHKKKGVSKGLNTNVFGIQDGVISKGEVAEAAKLTVGAIKNSAKAAARGGVPPKAQGFLAGTAVGGAVVAASKKKQANSYY